MTDYLYIPYKETDLSSKQKILLNEWRALRGDLHFIYANGKKIKDFIAPNSLHVPVFGKAGQPSRLDPELKLPSHLTRDWASLSRPYTVDDGKISLNLSKFAHQLEREGMFAENKRLCIKFYFYNSTQKSAAILAKAFIDGLNAETKRVCSIKVDYYYEIPPQIIEPSIEIKQKKIPSPTEHYVKNPFEHMGSLFTNSDDDAKLTQEQINEALTHYAEYKSSRCCGLSGLLHLNGLFSSHASAQAIAYLSNDRHNGQEKFTYATRFIANYPQNYFTQCLKSQIKTAIDASQEDWASHLRNEHQFAL